MKKIFITLSTTFLFALQAHAVYAEVYQLDKKSDKPIYILELVEKKVGPNIEIESVFKLDGVAQLKESGKINEATAEILEYKVIQLQTKEKGTVDIIDEKIRIKYEAEGKPENMVTQIVEGQLKKYFAERCLLDQPFIKNPDQTVGDYVKEHNARLGENIVVRRFSRLVLGELG